MCLSPALAGRPSTFIHSTNNYEVLLCLARVPHWRVSSEKGRRGPGFQTVTARWAGTGSKLKIAKIIFFNYTDDKGYKRFLKMEF